MGEAREPLDREQLAEAFERTRSVPVIRARIVTTSEGPGYGVETLVHDLLASEHGDAVAYHARRSRPLDVEVERRLAVMVEPRVEAVHDPSQFVVRMEFVAVDDTFWFKAPAIGDLVDQWRSASIDDVSAFASDPFSRLDAIERALLGEVRDTVESADGTRPAVLELNGDAIGPTLRERNPNRNLPLDPGQGVNLAVSIDVSPDGHVVFVEVDTTDWYVSLLSDAATVLPSLDLDRFVGRHSLAFARVEGEFEVTAPCAVESSAQCE